MYGDLYVLGKIQGEVELKDSDAAIYVQEIDNGIIKILNVSKYYEGVYKNKKIYLENKKIRECDLVKGEISNVKSSSCNFG